MLLWGDGRHCAKIVIEVTSIPKMPPTSVQEWANRSQRDQLEATLFRPKCQKSDPTVTCWSKSEQCAHDRTDLACKGMDGHAKVRRRSDIFGIEMTTITMLLHRSRSRSDSAAIRTRSSVTEK